MNNMEDSILNTIKSMLGGPIEGSNAFNTDTIIGINSALMTLNQLGVGPNECVKISDDSTTWSELLSDDKRLETAKEYVYLRTKLLVDPPTGTVLESMKQLLKEDEWRLNVQAEIDVSNDTTSKKLDYNDLVNTPTLNGMPLKGNVELDLNDWESSIVESSTTDKTKT